MSVSASASLNSATSALPVVLFFEDDDAGRRLLVGTHRYRRLPFDPKKQDFTRGEWVLITTSEKLLTDHYTPLHSPNVRIIAISSSPFSDGRIDAAVYSYLPPGSPQPLLERALENALDHMHLDASRREVNDRLNYAIGEIHELNQIGAALSAEHDTDKLLEKILTKAREITMSDAGSLYLVETVAPPSKATGEHAPAPAAEKPSEQPKAKPVAAFDPNAPAPVATPHGEHAEPKRQIRFKLVQNDSLALPFREVTMELSPRSIAGYVTLSGESVNIEDAYHLPEGVPFTFNRKFDEDSGYRTKSILAVPMRNQKGEILGVIQLINAKRDAQAKLSSLSTVVANVVPYTFRQQELALSMASQAAVALENSRLYAEIQAMLEGFVRASVIAIEARDPTTSGHSFRVSNLTVALAEAVDRLDSGLYAALRFSRSQMKEIRYAALLHDFGKVGVREEVLVKAKKLYPPQIDVIQQRFQFVKRSVESGVARRKLDYLLEKGRDAYLAKLPEFDAEFAQQVKQLDEFFAIVIQANEPSVMPAGAFEQLVDIGGTRYQDFEGSEHVLLSPDEVRLLSIRKGSLDDSERLQIESHVVHTFNFLDQIPWTKEIRSIPAIARGHHEKLNGLGYPYKLSAPQIPVQTRMMTISDIFDALSAADRPYKRAVPQERALEILGFAVKDKEIDPNLFQVFVEARVFDKWKIEPFPY